MLVKDGYQAQAMAVDKSATTEDIQRAHRKLARQWPPMEAVKMDTNNRSTWYF